MKSIYYIRILALITGLVFLFSMLNANNEEYDFEGNAKLPSSITYDGIVEEEKALPSLRAGEDDEPELGGIEVPLSLGNAFPLLLGIFGYIVYNKKTKSFRRIL